MSCGYGSCIPGWWEIKHLNGKDLQVRFCKHCGKIVAVAEIPKPSEAR